MLNVKQFRYLLKGQAGKNIIKILAFIFLYDLMFIKYVKIISKVYKM
jgi:hypothetical protein